MAKSFKPASSKPVAEKRTSEKDFLDFLDQERTETLPAASLSIPTEVQPESASNTSNTNTNEAGKNLVGETLPVEPSLPGSEKKRAQATASNTNNTSVTEVPEHDVRQTFIIDQQYLDRLKDYVHTRRVSGQYEYTQKQALHDALDLLFKGATIAARPEHIRQQEAARKERIKRGLSK